MAPQTARLTFSPGLKRQELNFQVALSDRPVDIYFVMDLSGSMGQHKVFIIIWFFLKVNGVLNLAYFNGNYPDF